MTDENLDEEFYIYLLVRTDLKMGKGKIAAQCGHAIQDLILNPRCPKFLLDKYLKGDHAKVCLKLNNLEHMEAIMSTCRSMGVLYHQVVDAGRTQIAPDTPTVLGIGPIRKKTAQPIIGDLKLL